MIRFKDVLFWHFVNITPGGVTHHYPQSCWLGGEISNYSIFSYISALMPLIMKIIAEKALKQDPMQSNS